MVQKDQGNIYLAFEMDREAETERPSRIFRPTILLHQIDQTPQNAPEKDENLSKASTVWQRLPAYDYVLFPWSQFPRASQFNISNLVGPKTKGWCPLGCSVATCPDQKHLQQVDTIVPKSTSLSVENDNGVDKEHRDRQTSNDCSQELLIVHSINTNESAKGNESIREDGVDKNPVTTKEVKKSTRSKKYQCPYCSVACDNTGQLRGHLRCHTGERPFACKVHGCTRKFARNEELTRHKRIHSGVRPFLCTTCNKSFGRKDHLQKHCKTHLTPKEKKSYLCPMCCQGYSRSDALKRHKATAHAQAES